MEEKRQELRELAATPGPWADGRNVERVLGRRHGGSMQAEQDAACIAAANPQAVLALLDELESCKARLARVEGMYAAERERVEKLACEAGALKQLGRAVDMLEMVAENAGRPVERSAEAARLEEALDWLSARINEECEGRQALCRSCPNDGEKMCSVRADWKAHALKMVDGMEGGMK